MASSRSGRIARLAAVLAVTASIPALAQGTTRAAVAKTATTIVRRPLPRFGRYAVVVTISPPGARWVFDNQPMHLLLDLAVGGWPGPPTSAAGFPATMRVDWVRVYD